MIVFIDFKKAFDIIHCGKLMTILKACGIERMCTDTKVKVVSPDGETEPFDILAGVL